MKVFIQKPGEKELGFFLNSEANRDYSYQPVGDSEKGRPAGFDLDENIQVLGNGVEVWEKAVAALRQWKMFPPSWTYIFPGNAALAVGTVLAMNARGLGLWWSNSCRIVYVINEANRFGFAYGTLPGHMERGEELFLIERDSAGQVTYRIRAYSHPRHWLARLAYPVMRGFQRRFARESKAVMLEICG